MQGQTRDFETAQPYKGYNRTIAQKLLETSVVKHALKTMGTPFLYKPSRLLGAMGTKNNQETTWTDRLDADHITPYRPGMAGCFRCPVNCRPLNDLHGGDRYAQGDGPEYVTLGKFGPNLGIDRIESVIRLNNICNDLGLDTASTGSTLSWAMELFQRGIITRAETGGIDLTQIDGLASYSALKLVAEIGTDMSRWPTEKHFASWLSLAPGSKISGGKRLSGRTKPSASRAAAQPGPPGRPRRRGC